METLTGPSYIDSISKDIGLKRIGTRTLTGPLYIDSSSKDLGL